MKHLVSLTMIVLFVAIANSQTKPIAADDYSRAFRYAVSETNEAFPFIFTVVVDEFEGGKKISSETAMNERQAAGVERITRTILAADKKSTTYQVKVGFGNVYCSNDGVTWRGPQKYECSGPSRLYGRRETESAKYSVEEKTVSGERVKIFREYLIFKSDGSENEFKETIATIDSRGFFISVVNNEGTAVPKAITLIRKQTWDLKTKFKPVVAPK